MSAAPKLGGEPLELRVPNSMARRWGVHHAWTQAGADSQCLLYVAAAALGLCWPRFQAKKDTPSWKHNLLAYGEEVLDFLLEHGCPLIEVQRAERCVEFDAGNAVSRVLAGTKRLDNLPNDLR